MRLRRRRSESESISNNSLSRCACYSQMISTHSRIYILYIMYNINTKQRALGTYGIYIHIPKYICDGGMRFQFRPGFFFFVLVSSVLFVPRKTRCLPNVNYDCIIYLPIHIYIGTCVGHYLLSSLRFLRDIVDHHAINPVFK